MTISYGGLVDIFGTSGMFSIHDDTFLNVTIFKFFTITGYTKLKIGIQFGNVFLNVIMMNSVISLLMFIVIVVLEIFIILEVHQLLGQMMLHCM